jgi:hypothetical protein
VLNIAESRIAEASGAIALSATAGAVAGLAFICHVFPGILGAFTLNLRAESWIMDSASAFFSCQAERESGIYGWGDVLTAYCGLAETGGAHVPGMDWSQCPHVVAAGRDRNKPESAAAIRNTTFGVVPRISFPAYALRLVTR